MMADLKKSALMSFGIFLGIVGIGGITYVLTPSGDIFGLTQRALLAILFAVFISVSIALLKETLS